MRAIVTVDCETDPFKPGRVPVPFLWGLFDGKHYREFRETGELIDYVKDREFLIYAHNGGKFDWHFLAEYMEPFRPLRIINGRLAQFHIGKSEFRDSWNVLPFPLAAYKKDEIDYSILEADKRHNAKNWGKIRKYLESDCRFLHDIVFEFTERYGSHLTIATASLRQWESLSGNRAPTTSREFYNLLSPYYYGGRVQCFASGLIHGNATILDINSAYPFAMTHSHPYGETPDISTRLPRDDEAVSRCMISLSARSLGAFPVRDGLTLDFPADGTMRDFHVTGWELQAAEETGTLKNAKIKAVVQFPEQIEFTDYVAHFYKMKQTAKDSGDKASYLFAKLFLNSLYGKFAANPENYSEFTIASPEYIEASQFDGWDFAGLFGPWAILSQPLRDEAMRYYHLGVGASITGFVRAHLWRALCSVDTPLYCDTDSIICRNPRELPTGPLLGEWNVEGIASHGGIGGKKLYAFQLNNGTWKKASKGAKLTPAQIMTIAGDGVVDYEPDVPTFSVHHSPEFHTRRIRRTA